MVEQRHEAVADQIRRGQEAGEEEQRDGGEELVLVEQAVVGLTHEIGEEVVGRFLAPPGDQLHEVGVELVTGPLDPAVRLRRAVEGVGRERIRMRGRNHSRSSSGTPTISPTTVTGIGKASSAITSASPRSASRSSRSLTMAPTRGRSASIVGGMK